MPVRLKQGLAFMDARFVNVAGDTMTGALTLFGAPTLDLHAATKKYVDDEIAGVDLSTRATTALSNLASVAINTSLISDTDSTDDLGSSSKYWANAYIDKLFLNATATLDGTTAGLTNVVGSLAVDTSILYVDAVWDRVGIGTTTTGSGMAGRLIVVGDGTALRLCDGATSATTTILFKRPDDWNPATIYQSYPGSYGGDLEFKLHPYDGVLATAPVTVVTFKGDNTILLADGVNIVVNTTTGTKIGTAITQKLGFFNATPVVQQAYTAISNPPTQAQVTAIRDALVNLGFMAAS